MTNETLVQSDRIIYLYRVTCLVNDKVYIGQTVAPSSRWRGHRRDSADPKVPFHRAIKKYGNDVFEFEVIASCKGQDNANELETELIRQYDSFISNGKGYNATHGGMNAPKSEAFKQMMRDWHASLSPEEKEARSKLYAEAMINQIATQGHPAEGRVVSEEERELHRKSRLENPIEYTPELRQKMSESHLGNQPSEETVQKQSESLKKTWEKRNAERFVTEDIRCQAPGCEVSGKAKYKIIDGVRYCNKHGLRMLRHQTVDRLPAFKYTEDNPMPDEVRKRCGAKNIGRIAHNRIVFTDEQVLAILRDRRSNNKIAKDFGVTEKVIKRIKSQNR